MYKCHFGKIICRLFWKLIKLSYLCNAIQRNGRLAEGLGNGLQNRLKQFDSATDLRNQSLSVADFFIYLCQINFEIMLKHIVMWKFKPEAEGRTRKENAFWMKEHLEDLVGKTPEIQSLEVGVNVNESEAAYDAVLVSTFEDTAALTSYKNNPLHQAVSAYCKKVRESRVVVDYYE